MTEFSKTRRKTVTCLIILAAILSLIAGCGSSSSKEVVARVNGEEISKDELYDVMVKSVGKQALDYLISKKIIELEAKNRI